MYQDEKDSADGSAVDKGNIMNIMMESADVQENVIYLESQLRDYTESLDTLLDSLAQKK